jgi:hypothetical protein
MKDDAHARFVKFLRARFGRSDAAPHPSVTDYRRGTAFPSLENVSGAEVQQQQELVPDVSDLFAAPPEGAEVFDLAE